MYATQKGNKKGGSAISIKRSIAVPSKRPHSPDNGEKKREHLWKKKKECPS